MNHYAISQCVKELGKKDLFITSEHRQLFSDLLNCYSEYPFFHKGLCKCMYLSSWDIEHYMIMLDILNDMTIGKSQNTDEMSDNGITLESQATGYERYVMQMSGAFIRNEPYVIPDEPIEEEGLRIMRMGLMAAEVIDEIFEKY
ncbi:MAG: hypothetical protein IJI25_02455 [Eubacterium sp.]|nr:hypothetical protein [Eubacterium sp.]